MTALTTLAPSSTPVTMLPLFRRIFQGKRASRHVNAFQATKEMPVSRWSGIRLSPLLFAFCMRTNLMFAAERAVLIDEQVAVFYPEKFDEEGNLPSLALLEEPKEIGPLPESWKTRVEFSSVFGKPVAHVAVDSTTDLYGSGEVYGRLARKGSTRILWNTDNYTYAKENGQRLYQTHPWVLGVRADGSAFGVLADNTWKQELSLGDSIEFRSEGPPFRVLVIEGSTPQHVLATLADLTGKTPMPPLWSLGFQQCRWSYYPASRAREIADTFRRKKIPIDVLWFDIHYMDQYKVFTFDPQNYPDPTAMNDYLHTRDMKSVWMIDPGVAWEKGYAVFDSGTDSDVWVKNGLGETYEGKVWPGKVAFPDYTQPEAARWWANLYPEFIANGIDGVWNDMNEPSDFSGPDGTIPINAKHKGGLVLSGENGIPLPAGSHLRYHNVYGMLMVKATREGILKANPDRRPFILTRSNYIGGQRYAATWTGDNDSTWEHLRISIPMVVNLGLSGQLFSGADIGGFEGNASPELFGHWIALGAFYPFSRAHTSVASLNQEPWEFGRAVENAARTALERRYRLMPYLYTQFYRASVNGLPIMQPTFFADLANPKLRAEDQTFLFGPDLLIVPRWADKPAIPKGSWRIINLVGEKSQKDKFQPDIHIRDGSIVPTGPIIQSTADYSLKKLTLYVSLDEEGKAEGQLYHDAGEGNGYLKGEYALLDFTAAREGEEVVVRFSRREGSYPIDIDTITVKLYDDRGETAGKGSLAEPIRIRH